MDKRLRSAVHGSLRWYEDIFTMHGIRTVVEGGVWWAEAEPPRWHSAAKAIAPDAPVDRAVRAVEGFEHCSVADSFGRWDLTAAGFELLFEATWVHHVPPAEATGSLPEGWSVVTGVEEFGVWNAAHDTTDVLLPSILADPRFIVLGAQRDGRLVGGAVIHDCGDETVELSNVWALPGRQFDHRAAVSCAARLRPGRAVVGYERGDDLDALVDVGFVPLGPQVVWVR